MRSTAGVHAHTPTRAAVHSSEYNKQLYHRGKEDEEGNMYHGFVVSARTKSTWEAASPNARTWLRGGSSISQQFIDVALLENILAQSLRPLRSSPFACNRHVSSLFLCPSPSSSPPYPACLHPPFLTEPKAHKHHQQYPNTIQPSSPCACHHGIIEIITRLSRSEIALEDT